MKLSLLLLSIFLGACATKAVEQIQSSAAVSDDQIVDSSFVVSGYEFAVGDKGNYIKALLGKADYITENLHGQAIWRYKKYSVEFRFDDENKLKSWTDTSYLP